MCAFAYAEGRCTDPDWRPAQVTVAGIYIGKGMGCIAYFYRSLEGSPILAALAAGALLTNLVVYVRTKKYRHHSNLAWNGTLRQVFYLSEASFPSCDPYSPPPYTCISVYVYTLYFFIQGRGRGES
jgi:hypothetical protein